MTSIGSDARRQLQAVLHIQWLSFKNSLRRRSERLGLVLSVLVATLWYGLWSGGAVGLLAFCLEGAPDRLEHLLPSALFFILMYWQLSPLLTASMGVSLDLRKMALYPIGVDTLFVVECLLRVSTAFEMVLLLGGITLGMLLRTPGRAMWFLPMVLLFLLFNVLLSAGTRNLMERLMRRKGMREAVLLVLVMTTVLPQLILWSDSADRVGRGIFQVMRFLPASVLPSSVLARSYLGTGRPVDGMVQGGWCLIAFAFGLLQFRRSFYFDGARRRRAPAASQPVSAAPRWSDRLFRLPGRFLPDPLGILVEKEIRYLVRSPRFRFLFMMGCSFGVVAWLPFGMGRSVLSSGTLHASFLTLLSLYALLLVGQVTFLNCFGFDRSAARYFFWMPVSPARLLLAKNMASGVFVIVQILMLGAICTVLRLHIGLYELAEALIVTSISLLYLSSVGNFTSVLFAIGVSPERVSRGAGRGIQGLIIFLYPLLISPIVAAYFARYYWNSPRAFYLLMLLAALGGLAVYSATLPLAARLAYSRREKLLEELSRGEGPIVSE
jgi:hypothetical protein